MPRHTLLPIMLTCLLSACGFHLRGNDAANFSIKALALSASDRYGKTVDQLSDALERRQVEVRTDAPLTLVLLREKKQSRVFGRGSSAQVTEIELSLSLDYQLLGKKQLLLVEDNLQVRRVYAQDDNNIASTRGEQNQLEDEMRHDLIEQLLMRLQALTPESIEQLQRRAEQQRAQLEAERQLRAVEADGQ